MNFRQLDLFGRSCVYFLSPCKQRVRYSEFWLNATERKTKKKVRRQLLKSDPICYFCKCKKKLKGETGTEVHRLNGNRGYSLENCVLTHQKCHRQYHEENPTVRPPAHASSEEEIEGKSLILKKTSMRYVGKSFLYWWDISPGFLTRMDKSSAVEFVQKGSGKKCRVPTAVLKGYLKPERKTSRRKGNHGIKVLKGREGELAFEPPSGDDNWLFLGTEWQ